MSDDTIEQEIESPCPRCSGQLAKMSKYDGTLFMGITAYIVFCKKCDFEENADKWQERLESK